MSDATVTPEGSPRSDDSGIRIPPALGAKANDVALLKLMERTGYNIIQENGQRKYGGPPPNWTGPAPLKGSEVFVGKIPRDLFEDELAPVFEKVGTIYEIRLMMDFSGTNRGYAFVMYSSPAEANNAVRRLNNYEIRKGRFIGVVKSVDNCRLFVGGLPKNKVREEIFDEMSKVTEGVVDVIVYSSVTDKSKSRGFAFVEYRNHKAAAMARRKLIPGRIQLWGQTIAVDWAEPEPDVDEETMSKVTVLYARNLLLSTTEDLIRDTFNAASDGGVERVKKLRDFAFVHFSNRDKAYRAQQKLNHTELEGSLIEVTWAKPIDKSRQERYRAAAAAAAATSAHVSMVVPPMAAGGAPPVHPAAAGFVEPPFFSLSSGLGSPGSPGQPGLLRSPAKSSRGRGAGGVRGVRNFLPPSPAVLRTAAGQRRPVEVLHDLCINNKWGEPQYQLHTTVKQTSPADPPLQLFLYKVTLPGLPSEYNSFQGCRLSLNPEEARILAAETALGQLGVPYENVVEPASPAQAALLPRALATPGFGGPSPTASPAGFSGAAYHLLYNPYLYAAGKVLPAFGGHGGVYDGYGMGGHGGHSPAIY